MYKRGINMAEILYNSKKCHEVAQSINEWAAKERRRIMREELDAIEQDIFRLVETAGFGVEDVHGIADLAEQRAALEKQSWTVHPRVWRSLRMRDLPYFLYRKRRHQALIPQ